MPTHVDQVMQLLCRVAREKEMRAAIKHSREGASLAFVGAFVGGLLEGPPGIAIGGALGGLLGAWVASGQFKPVPQIIMELPPAKQQKLYNEVIAIIRNFDWTDMVQLTALVMGNSDLKFLLTSAVEKFFIRELRAQMNKDNDLDRESTTTGRISLPWISIPLELQEMGISHDAAPEPVDEPILVLELQVFQEKHVLQPVTAPAFLGLPAYQHQHSQCLQEQLLSDALKLCLHGCISESCTDLSSKNGKLRKNTRVQKVNASI